MTQANHNRSKKEFEPEMVLIPAGPFLMGSPADAPYHDLEEPDQFELTLYFDYAIGKYPVTVGQYRAFIEASGYDNASYWTAVGWSCAQSNGWKRPRYWGKLPWTDSDDLPVVGVSWYEALAYTRWLTEATGRDYRLPTEAEWEKAARGGLQIPDGRGGMTKNPNPARIWPWGDEHPNDKLLNFRSRVGHTTPVGRYPNGVSPYGVFDMAGNVWEWCLSKWADPYQPPPGEGNDPQGDSPRVLRGGSWGSYYRGCRVSHRSWCDPVGWAYNFGFRVGGVVPILP